MRIQLAKETRQLPVGGKVQWPGVLVFEKFPEGIMISGWALSQLAVASRAPASAGPWPGRPQARPEHGTCSTHGKLMEKYTCLSLTKLMSCL